MNRTKGFTLVELLVALAVLSVVMVSTTSLFGNSIQASRVVVTSSQLQQNLRNAAQIMGDEIQRAIYVFPPQSSTIPLESGGSATVDWSSFVLGAGNRKTGPHEPSNGQWIVPSTPSTTTPPFLAMITAPLRPDVSCRNADTGAITVIPASNVSEGDGCYKFIAYFPVLRPKVTRGLVGNSSTSNELLEENSQQSSTWVIMEFRLNLTDQTGTVPWNRVGCQNRASPCLVPPTIDPIRAASDLPVLTCTITCDLVTRLPNAGDVNTFRSKMLATVAWINTQATTTSPEILVDDIDSSYANGGPGFVIRTADSVDPRGVFQVRLLLRGALNGKVYGNGDLPIGFYFVPRNIAPFKAAPGT
jgi:prepilin-type N-terminal cleavage/methylation domain-containing protein